MVKTISDGIVISPIKNGTVIDHITPGEGLTVLRILGIRDGTNVTVIVASNVPSSRGGRKDMVKIENRELLKDEVDKIALVAPDATISIIRNFKVSVKKTRRGPKADHRRDQMPESKLHHEYQRAGPEQIRCAPAGIPLSVLRFAHLIRDGHRRLHLKIFGIPETDLFLD